MKTINIGGKGFSNLIKELDFKPHKNIIKAIDSKMFPLDANNVFNYKPEYLAYKELDSSLSLKKRRFGENKNTSEIKKTIYGLIHFINKQEKPIREKLIHLAVETIRDLYEVPKHIRLEAFIENRIDLDTEQNDNPNPFLELSLKQKNDLRDEIQKRIILNGICHGSSMYIWKSVYYIVSEELKKINPMLIELYDQYTAGINFLFWTMDPKSFSSTIEEEQQFNQGFNQIKFDEPGMPSASITCKAINFPVLLHELNKGVMDYIICAGIPKHFTESELIYYYSKADNYENEFWHYLLSPTLWVDLLEVADKEPKYIPHILLKLSKMTYQQLTSFFRDMIDDKDKVKQLVKTWNI